MVERVSISGYSGDLTVGGEFLGFNTSLYTPRHTAILLSGFAIAVAVAILRVEIAWLYVASKMYCFKKLYTLIRAASCVLRQLV